jgi:signal transduction histidine kinase
MLRRARDAMTQHWLERIAARVTIPPDHIFPTEDLLDHVPLLVDGIADYMENPADEISADVPVIAKAMELGELRLAQGFSVHEILKEYEILGGVLFSFLVDTVDHIEEECTRSELLACAQRLFRAVSVIQQVTATQYLRMADDEVHEREERLRSFNRMVTHELKNRIGAVSGASRMLAEPWIENDPDQRRHFVSVVARNADGMQEVLRDLLTLSGMQTNTRQQRNVLLMEAAAEAARQLRDMAQERGVQIRLAEDIPPIEVDAAAIELCLVNYISNGIKYADMSKAERWVEVRAHEASSPAGHEEMVIEVRDNGIGIAPSDLIRVMQPFVQVDGLLDRKYEGTGLGLPLAKAFAEAHGGHLSLRSVLGQGTVATVVFPCGRTVRLSADPLKAEEQGADMDAKAAV